MFARASYQVETVIHRPAAEVFDYLSDLRNEVGWNPGARRIVKVTDGPIGVGSRFEAEWRSAPRTIVEIVQFEPPRRWQTRSRSWGLDVLFTGELNPARADTRYTALLEVNAGGVARLLLPLAVRAMRRQDEEHMRRIVRALERGDPARYDRLPTSIGHGDGR